MASLTSQETNASLCIDQNYCNGGICRPIGNNLKPECYCPLGFGGLKCLSKVVTLEDHRPYALVQAVFDFEHLKIFEYVINTLELVLMLIILVYAMMIHHKFKHSGRSFPWFIRNLAPGHHNADDQEGNIAWKVSSVHSPTGATCTQITGSRRNGRDQNPGDELSHTQHTGMQNGWRRLNFFRRFRGPAVADCRTQEETRNLAPQQMDQTDGSLDDPVLSPLVTNNKAYPQCEQIKRT